MSEIGLRIRVDDDLRLQFLEICRAQDTTAAQLIRGFMRGYVDQYGLSAKQRELFETSKISVES